MWTGCSPPQRPWPSLGPPRAAATPRPTWPGCRGDRGGGGCSGGSFGATAGACAGAVAAAGHRCEFGWCGEGGGDCRRCSAPELLDGDGSLAGGHLRKI